MAVAKVLHVEPKLQRGHITKVAKTGGSCGLLKFRPDEDGIVKALLSNQFGDALMFR